MVAHTGEREFLLSSVSGRVLSPCGTFLATASESRKKSALFIRALLAATRSCQSLMVWLA